MEKSAININTEDIKDFVASNTKTPLTREEAVDSILSVFREKFISGEIHHLVVAGANAEGTELSLGGTGGEYNSILILDGALENLVREIESNGCDCDTCNHVCPNKRESED